MSPPAWVRKRDGSIVAFEPDKISRALFAASESVGRPDPFLARELADGVVHFLAAELDENTASTQQLAEIVVKVVRELGQPAIAQAFADGAWVRTRHAPNDREPSAESVSARELIVSYPAEITRDALVRSCLSSFALEAVYSRDLAAAHRAGLLTLTGLEFPFELAAYAPGPLPIDRGVFESIAGVTRVTGGVLAIDSPEYALVAQPERFQSYTRELVPALRDAGLSAVVNLNCASSPSWAEPAFPEPLFVGHNSPGIREHLSEISDVLVDQMATLADGASPTIRIDWHLSEEDLRAEAADGMKRLARRAIAGSALAFVFDRPRCPIALAEGVDRGNPAVLLTVGLNLPVLATQMGTGTDAAGRFLQRLPSLVRLALSAGVQKRDFLRQHSPDQSELKRGFLLDRARLVVAPIGIQPTVQRLLGQSPYETPEALDYARRIVERLHDVVKEDGSSRHLDVVLDGSRLGKPQGEPDGKSQLHFATELSRGGSLGTLCLFFSEAGMPRQDEFVDWLRLAWKRSEITRLQIVTVGETDPQLKFDS